MVLVFSLKYHLLVYNHTPSRQETLTQIKQMCCGFLGDLRNFNVLSLHCHLSKTQQNNTTRDCISLMRFCYYAHGILFFWLPVFFFTQHSSCICIPCFLCACATLTCACVGFVANNGHRQNHNNCTYIHI